MAENNKDIDNPPGILEKLRTKFFKKNPPVVNTPTIIPITEEKNLDPVDVQLNDKISTPTLPLIEERKEDDRIKVEELMKKIPEGDPEENKAISSFITNNLMILQPFLERAYLTGSPAEASSNPYIDENKNIKVNDINNELNEIDEYLQSIGNKSVGHFSKVETTINGTLFNISQALSTRTGSPEIQRISDELKRIKSTYSDVFLKQLHILEANCRKILESMIGLLESYDPNLSELEFVRCVPTNAQIESILLFIHTTDHFLADREIQMDRSISVREDLDKIKRRGPQLINQLFFMRKLYAEKNKEIEESVVYHLTSEETAEIIIKNGGIQSQVEQIKSGKKPSRNSDHGRKENLPDVSFSVGFTCEQYGPIGFAMRFKHAVENGRLFIQRIGTPDQHSKKVSLELHVFNPLYSDTNRDNQGIQIDLDDGVVIIVPEKDREYWADLIRKSKPEKDNDWINEHIVTYDFNPSNSEYKSRQALEKIDRNVKSKKRLVITNNKYPTTLMGAPQTMFQYKES